jgi:hypothetical protein
MRNRDETALFRVPEVMVAARYSDDSPTIGLDQFDDLGAVHTSFPPSIHTITQLIQ